MSALWAKGLWQVHPVLAAALSACCGHSLLCPSYWRGSLFSHAMCAEAQDYGPWLPLSTCQDRVPRCSSVMTSREDMLVDFGAVTAKAYSSDNFVLVAVLQAEELSRKVAALEKQEAVHAKAKVRHCRRTWGLAVQYSVHSHRSAWFHNCLGSLFCCLVLTSCPLGCLPQPSQSCTYLPSLPTATLGCLGRA